MKRVHAGGIARGLERLVDPGTISGLLERQVLARFVERRDPVAFEAIVIRYGPMVAEVEVLELTLEALKGRIRNALTLIDQIEDDSKYQAVDPKSRDQEVQRREEKAERMHLKVSLWQEKYRQTREQIANYKYRIATQVLRARFPMTEAGDSSESFAEVFRRIDRLEAKVDRIADSIAKGKAR
jgi:hypothetical protein